MVPDAESTPQNQNGELAQPSGEAARTPDAHQNSQDFQTSLNQTFSNLEASATEGIRVIEPSQSGFSPRLVQTESALLSREQFSSQKGLETLTIRALVSDEPQVWVQYINLMKKEIRMRSDQESIIVRALADSPLIGDLDARKKEALILRICSGLGEILRMHLHLKSSPATESLELMSAFAFTQVDANNRAMLKGLPSCEAGSTARMHRDVLKILEDVVIHSSTGSEDPERAAIVDRVRLFMRFSCFREFIEPLLFRSPHSTLDSANPNLNCFSEAPRKTGILIHLDKILSAAQTLCGGEISDHLVALWNGFEDWKAQLEQRPEHAQQESGEIVQGKWELISELQRLKKTLVKTIAFVGDDARTAAILQAELKPPYSTLGSPFNVGNINHKRRYVNEFVECLAGLGRMDTSIMAPILRDFIEGLIEHQNKIQALSPSLTPSLNPSSSIAQEREVACLQSYLSGLARLSRIPGVSEKLYDIGVQLPPAQKIPLIHILNCMCTDDPLSALVPSVKLTNKDNTHYSPSSEDRKRFRFIADQVRICDSLALHEHVGWRTLYLSNHEE
jgi:hypothetical protein